jgi:hypothetical protein
MTRPRARIRYLALMLYVRTTTDRPVKSYVAAVYAEYDARSDDDFLLTAVIMAILTSTNAVLIRVASTHV